MKNNLRNFATITLVMLVVFFMTMFSGTAKAVLNNYDQNAYGYSDGFSIGYESSDASADADLLDEDAQNYLFYAGSSEDTSNMASQWCKYRKIKFAQSEEIPALDELKYLPEFILVDGSLIDKDNADTLKELASGGVDIIISGMPDYSVFKEDEEFSNLLGVTSLRTKSVEIKAVHIYEDFMLGGETYYESPEDNEEEDLMDLETNMSWYRLSSGVTRLMAGVVDDDTYDEVMANEEESLTSEGDDDVSDADNYKNEYMPPIAWYKLNANNRVFVVNGDYLTGLCGLGFLSGMEYMASEYQLYPVVNAQVISYTNYASASYENTEELVEKYARDYIVIQRDLIWTGIASVINYNNGYPSCFVTTKINNNVSDDVDEEFFDYFFRLLRESEGEAGITLAQYNETDITDKLKDIKNLLDEVMPDYKINAAYIGDVDSDDALNYLEASGFDTVTSLLSEYDKEKGLLYYASSDVVDFSVTNSGTSHTYSQDLEKMAIETALGYSVISTDMAKVAYPQTEDDEWQNVYKKLSSYSNTYWKAYRTFSDTSVSEAAARVRAFLTEDYEESVEDNVLTLNVDSEADEAYFVLRTHGKKIKSITGGSYDEIEDGAYLITDSDAEVTVTLKEEGSGFLFN